MESRIARGYLSTRPLTDDFSFLEEIKIGLKKYARLWSLSRTNAPFIEVGNRLIREMRTTSRTAYTLKTSYTKRIDQDIMDFLR